MTGPAGRVDITTNITMASACADPVPWVSARSQSGGKQAVVTWMRLVNSEMVPMVFEAGSFTLAKNDGGEANYDYLCGMRNQVRAN